MENPNDLSREDLDMIGMMAVMTARELGTIDKQYTDRSKVPACRIVPKDVYSNARKQHTDKAQELVTEQNIHTIVPEVPPPPAPPPPPAEAFTSSARVQPTKQAAIIVDTTPSSELNQMELPLPGINVEMTKIEQRLFEFMNTVEGELKTIRSTVLTIKKNIEKNHESKETACKCTNTTKLGTTDGKGEKPSSTATTACASGRFPDA